MLASRHTLAFTVLTLIASSSLAAAADVRVLSVGATQVAAKSIAADFEKLTGHQIVFTIRPPFEIDKELADKTYDAIILSVPAMDVLDQAGGLTPTSRVALARVGVGLVVKEGAPLPDISTPDRLKAAVLAARSLTYGNPAVPNTSGAIVGAAFAKLGIVDELKSKTRHLPLQAGGEAVAKGEIEIGLFNLSEVPKGVTVAGPLPGELQGYTVYDAAVLAKGNKDAAGAAAAAAFVKYLASAPAATHWEAAKLEPALSYMQIRASQ